MITKKIVEFIKDFLIKRFENQDKSWEKNRIRWKYGFDINEGHLNGGLLKKVRDNDYWDVRCFIDTKNEHLNRIIKKNNLDVGTYDERALKCLNWVIDNITYVKDSSRKDGLSENWYFPTETLTEKIGDCEDGAVLLASLMICVGIPEERIRITCGNVVDPAKKQIFGHAYVRYFSERPKLLKNGWSVLAEPRITYGNNEWVILDWCFYPGDYVFCVKPLTASKYKDIWYQFNSKYCWKEAK